MGTGMWDSIEKRITWDRVDFLDVLPYDTGVFDMVHIRFIGLGVPETRWVDVLEEAARVLKRGGTLEIVEMSYTLPNSFPASLRNSFASLLLADLVQPYPVLPLRFILPTTPLLNVAGAVRPVFEKSWSNPPAPLNDCVFTWVSSALEYKGTGLITGQAKTVSHTAARVRRQLVESNGKMWIRADEGDDTEYLDHDTTVWAWVVTKV